MRSEAVIIGGGPAGASLAIRLAREGVSTTLFERSNFPRFHVGESLLPASTPIFEELGVYDRLMREFKTKPGGCWYYDDTPVLSDFRDCRDSASFAKNPHAFMVERAKFDGILLERAADAGAKVMAHHAVTKARFDDGRLTGLEVRDLENGARRSIDSHMVFDCSGYHAFLPRQLGIRRMNRLKRMAIFAHYEVDAYEDERVRDGWFMGEMLYDGWIWLIPLSATKISIGVVARLDRYKDAHGTKESFLDAMIAGSPLAQRALRGARRVSDVHLYGNLGYRSDRYHGKGWTLVGDAAVFIDPCYSTGVHLALETARIVAGIYLENRQGTEDALAGALASYEAHLRQQEKMILMLVESFYMASRSKWLRRIVPRLNSIGHIYQDFVQFTGGDFLYKPRGVYTAYYMHKLISAFLPQDPSPAWARSGLAVDSSS